MHFLVRQLLKSYLSNPAMPKKTVGCAVETAIEIIGGRWKVLILQELFVGTKRFSELHRGSPESPTGHLRNSSANSRATASSSEKSTARSRRRWSIPSRQSAKP